MPTAFDLQKYEANFDPLTAIFVNFQDVMKATGNVWGQVVSLVIQYLPQIIEEIPTILEQLLPAMAQEIIAALEGAITDFADLVFSVLQTATGLDFTSLDHLVPGIISGINGIINFPLAALQAIFGGWPGLLTSPVGLMELLQGIVQLLTDIGQLNFTQAGTDLTSLLALGFDGSALVTAFTDLFNGFEGVASAGSLFTQIIALLMQAINGTVGGTITDLTNWANSLPILSTLTQALTGTAGGYSQLTSWASTLGAAGAVLISDVTGLAGYLTNLSSTGILSAAGILGLDASKITSGTFADSFVPGLAALQSTIISSQGGSGTGLAGVLAALQNIPQASVTNLVSNLATITTNVTNVVAQASQNATDILNMITNSGASNATNFGMAVSNTATRTKNIVSSLWGGTGNVIGTAILTGQIPALPLSQITNLTALLAGFDTSGATSILTQLGTLLTLPISAITGLGGYLANLSSSGVLTLSGLASGALPSGVTAAISQITSLAGYLAHLSSSGVLDAITSVTGLPGYLTNLSTAGAYLGSLAISSITGLGGYLTNLSTGGVLSLAGLASGALPSGVTAAISNVTGLAGYLTHLSTSGIIDGIAAVTGLGPFLTNLNPSTGAYTGTGLLTSQIAGLTTYLTHLSGSTGLLDAVSSVTGLSSYLTNLNTAGAWIGTVANLGLSTLLTYLDPATGKWTGNLATLGTTIGGYFNNLSSSGVLALAGLASGALPAGVTAAISNVTGLAGYLGHLSTSGVLDAISSVTGLAGYLTNLGTGGAWTGALSTLGLATILSNLDAATGKWTGNLATLGTTIGAYFTNLSSAGAWTGNLASLGSTIGGYFTNLSSAGAWLGNVASLGLSGFLANLNSSGNWIGSVANLGLATILSNINASTGAWTGSIASLGLSSILSNLTAAGLYQGALNAQTLYNQIPTSLVGLVPYSHVGTGSPNLISGGDFPNAGSVTGTGWTWNGGDGHTANGCAQTTANGTLLTLVSNIISVTQGQAMTIGAWVKYTSLVAAASSNALAVQVAAYLGTTPVSTTTIASIASPSGTASWTQLSGTWTVPSGVDNIVVQLVVTQNATAGTVEYDDASAVKTGLMQGHWLSSVQGGASNIAGTVAGDLQSVIDNIWNSTASGPATSGNLVASITAALQAIPHTSVSSPAALPGDIGAALQAHVDAGVTGILNAVTAGTAASLGLGSGNSQNTFGGLLSDVTKYLGFNYPNQAAPPATSVAGQVATNQNNLRNRATQKPSFLSIDPSADSVFPLSTQQGTTPNTVNAGSSTALIGLIGIQDGGIKSAIWWYNSPAWPAGMSAVFKVYKVNTSNGSLGTAIWTSASVSGLAAGWQSLSISPSITTNPGDWYAVEIAATGSSTIQIVGIPGHWLPAHPTAFPASMGMSRALPSGTPAYSSTVPWFALAGSAGPQVFAPVLTQFANPGAYSYTWPTWANHLDIIVLGGGGAGQDGYFTPGGAGGAAGVWNAVTLNISTQLTGATQITGTVGGGGGASTAGGGATGSPGGASNAAASGSSWGGISGAGGNQGTGGASGNPAGTGLAPSPNPYTFNGSTYYGGAAQTLAQTTGNAPGGGGGGGNAGIIGTYIGGGNGAQGSVWILAYQ